MRSPSRRPLTPVLGTELCTYAPLVEDQFDDLAPSPCRNFQFSMRCPRYHHLSCVRHYLQRFGLSVSMQTKTHQLLHRSIPPILKGLYYTRNPHIRIAHCPSLPSSVGHPPPPPPVFADGAVWASIVQFVSSGTVCCADRGTETKCAENE